MTHTTDPNDPRLGHGIDAAPTSQNATYLVLSEEMIARGFMRPVLLSYQHTRCGMVTTMSRRIAETYAADPQFYGATYCCGCQKHLPLDEFEWIGTQHVTWARGGPVRPSDDCVTANHLKVGT